MSSSHILVVDDEADIRGLLKEILSEEGYEVDVAANAAQARASRARQVPDLVLLDIWMPDVDGITLLREWSAGVADGCPVVMMSGHSTVETAVEATRLGAFDFVEKPLSLAKLLRTVERALDAGRRHRQSGKLLGAPLAIPVGKSRVMQQLRTELQQIAIAPFPGAAGRRAGLRARGLCALPARAGAARRGAVRDADREQPARRGRGGAPLRARRGGRQGRRPARGGRQRHTVHPRGRGSAPERAAPAGRRVRIRAVHAHGRPRAGAVPRPTAVLRAAGHRAARRQRGLAARPARAA